jgi:hypothetical protein
VTSVDRPETSYPEETVYEMEAAGFCSATARFASAELIQVVKVISDNAQTPPERLTADRVEELIEGQLEAIVQIVEQTATLAGEIDARRQPPPALRGFTERWRFTTTQRRQLERLLRRLAALEPASPTATDFSDRTSAQAVIAALASRLAAHPPGLG